MSNAARKPRYSPPNRGGVSHAEILVVPPGAGMNVVILSQGVVGVWTHYWQGRTHPCTHQPKADGQEEIVCHVPHELSSLRWQGWLAIQKPYGPAKSYFVAITSGSVEECPGLVNPKYNLRGMNLVLRRSTESKQSKLLASLGLGLHDGRMFPESPCVKTFLERLWGKVLAIGPHDHKPGEKKKRGKAPTESEYAYALLDGEVPGSEGGEE